MASSSRGSFSLASLFLLTAAVSALAAAMASSVEHPPKDITFGIVCAIAMACLGAVIGVVAGANSHRWFRGACLGFFVGALVGAAAGWQLAVPPDWRMVCVGAVLLVALSLVVRKLSAKTSQGENAAAERSPF